MTDLPEISPAPTVEYSKTGHRHKGIDEPRIDYNDLLNTPSAPEWTYISKLTFANSSTTQSFSSFASYDLYKIRFDNVKQGSGAGALQLQMTVNNITTGSYDQVLLVGATLAAGTGGTSWTINGASVGGSAVFSGEYTLMGKAQLSIKTIFGNGGCFNNSDQTLIRGIINNSADVTVISILLSDPLTGTIELWGKNNQ